MFNNLLNNNHVNNKSNTMKITQNALTMTLATMAVQYKAKLKYDVKFIP